MTRHSVLIVDDEPLARRRLARLVAQLDDVTLAGEAHDVESAYAQVREQAPDIVLLDIQMPGASGFDLIERLGAAAPAVVFVTAFDHFALRAFDARAADYVTKPVDPGRLAAAIGRALAAARAKGREERIAELDETVATLRAALREQDGGSAGIWVKTRTGHVRIPAGDIVSIQAERDYSRIHVADRSYLLHESLRSLEQRVAPDDFIRIHRSTIVRRDRIAAIRTGPFGALIAALDDGSELRVGRTYAAQVRTMLSRQSA